LSVVSVVCLSGRGLCDGLITRPEESYRLWCILVCDLEASRMRRPWSALVCYSREKHSHSNAWVMHLPIYLKHVIRMFFCNVVTVFSVEWERNFLRMCQVDVFELSKS
jgi:hypothetical protein